jgi:hypothetical protein
MLLLGDLAGMNAAVTYRRVPGRHGTEHFPLAHLLLPSRRARRAVAVGEGNTPTRVFSRREGARGLFFLRRGKW